METVDSVAKEQALTPVGGTLEQTTFVAFYGAMPAVIQERFRAAVKQSDENLKRKNYPGTMPSATLKTTTTGQSLDRHVMPSLPVVFINIVRRFLPVKQLGVYSPRWDSLVFADVVAYWQSVAAPFEVMLSETDPVDDLHQQAA